MSFLKSILTMLGVFGVLTIIFVRAGEKTGESGATQSAKIINATGSQLNQLFKTATGA